MADKKISQLSAATTPLAGTEVLPIVQSGSTVKVAVNDLTAGKAVSMSALTATSTALVGNVAQQGILDVGISGATSNQFLTGGVGNNAATGVFKIGSGLGRGASVQGFRGGSSNVHHLDLYSYNSADVHVMRMDSNSDAKVIAGNLVIGTAAKGIDFSANTGAAGMTSELLNWYEEGTWTAVISDGTTDATMLNSSCTYTRIGRQVTVCGYIATSDITGITGNLIIKGLPFAIANGNQFFSAGSVGNCGGLNITANQVVSIYGVVNTTTIDVRLWDATTGTTGMTPAEWSADGNMVFSLTYFA